MNSRCEQQSTSSTSARSTRRSSNSWRRTGSCAPVARSSCRLNPTPRFVSLRTLSDKRYHILNQGDGQVIEEADAYKVIEEFYPGAVFLHQGDSYLVTDNDHEQQVVHAIPTTQNYYTDAIIRSDVVVQDERDHRDYGDVGLSFGKVVVSEQTVGFIKKSFHIETEVGREYIDTPEISYETMALWITVPDAMLDTLKEGGYDIAGSLQIGRASCRERV